MTIDETIKFEEAEIEGERQLYDNGGFAEYHEQLVKWLEELKDYRDKNKIVVKVDVMNIQELKDKIIEAYEQGRADKYQEIVSAYMLLTEKQVTEIREDAIEEFLGSINKLDRFWFADKDENPITPKMVDYEEIQKIAEKLKEQNNEKS